MSKILVHFRMDKEKLRQLKLIANQSGNKYSKLIREKIDEIVGLDNIEVKAEAIKLIKQLREPFAYVRTQRGKKRADKTRQSRKYIADKLEEIFNLKNGVKKCQ